MAVQASSAAPSSTNISLERSPRLGFFAVVLIALAGASVAVYFGTGLHPIWLFAWIAPIPVLFIVPLLSRRWAFAASMLVWAIGGLNQWRYLHGVIQIPLVVTIASVLLPALVFAVGVMAYRGLRVWQ